MSKTECSAWLAYNGETKRLIVVPSAVDEDAARSLAAGHDSDGDELSLVKIPSKGKPVDVTDQLGIEVK